LGFVAKQLRFAEKSRGEDDEHENEFSTSEFRLNRAHLLVPGYDGVPPEESRPAGCEFRISLPWHVRSERLPSRRCRASGSYARSPFAAPAG